jgi:uncharacterized protein
MTESSRPSVGQAYLLFVGSLLLVATVGFGAQAAMPRGGLAVTLLVCILLPAVWFVRRKGLPLATGLRLLPIRWVSAILAVGVGVSGWGVAVLLQRLTTLVIGPSPPVPGLQAESIPGWLIALFVGAALPGLCEEALFRGAIQGVLERRGVVYGVTITALLFGIFHLNPWTLIPATFLGLVFGTVAVRTGSTVAAILAHAANNATAITVSFFLLRDRPDALTPIAGVLAAVFVLFGAAFWWATRSATVAPPALASVPAALPRKPAFWLGAAAAVLIGIVLALVIALMAAIEIVRVETAEFEPEIPRDGPAVVLMDKAHSRPLREGMFVSFQHDDRPTLGRVLEVEATTVRLRADGREIEVARDEVLGIVIHPKTSGSPDR